MNRPIANFKDHLQFLARTASEADRMLIADMLALNLLTAGTEVSSNAVVIPGEGVKRPHWTQTVKGRKMLAERAKKQHAKAKH